MEEGLYESLVTKRLRGRIDGAADVQIAREELDEAEAPHILARHVGHLVEQTLAGQKDGAKRLALVNNLVELLARDEEVVETPATQLLSVARESAPGTVGMRLVRPQVPLSDAALLTNAHDEPSLGAELKAEIATAESVDLLCAFVKWHGVRTLEKELRELHERGKTLRIVTTTYMGATERRALDRLIREFGAEVRIQYDALRTRLHAKAWLFHRNTGFNTAYVGSSNLSRAALLDGVEWNVRLSGVATPTLLDKFSATFETYWNDPFFESYDPDTDRDRLDDALAEAGGSRPASGKIMLSGLDVRPFAYQQEMLEALAAEREVHDRHRNLIVAATGTGKTVIAALDYRALCDLAGQRPTLLFVAHRKEILEQTLRTYREVLGDANFGELYVDGKRPERWRHVFASVQSLNVVGIESIPADHFDVVVIDEFHHAAAKSYRALLEHLTPKELLALTATPERADGTDVREFFGGRTAAELRLWDALGAELLCPFHYFAVADNTDLSRITWRRGRYDEAELSNIYTGNDARARIILSEVRDKIVDPHSMRALGFCVSVAHAEYMARVFTEAGIPARAVSGQTGPGDRRAALDALRNREVNALFSAELFNEGLDIPDVDTVLFLRPTESATIFLQQLGRGLRRTANKPVLTVLDFVGLHRREFRWDRKLSALTGRSGKRLVKDVESGFPFLPSGCQIILDRTTQASVLENIKSQVTSRWSQVVAELKRYESPDLVTFLNESGLDLSEILKKGQQSWTKARRDASLPTPPGSELEEKLLKRVRAFAHVDDKQRAEIYRTILADDGPTYDELSLVEQRVARMLFFSVWSDAGGFSSFSDGLKALRREQAWRSELGSVVDIAFDSARNQTFPLNGPLSGLPLRVHARYQREEILAALDYANLERKPNSFREGVLYVKELNVDAFFVTLAKSESDYSPTTMYRDYPISPELFHWESQSTTTLRSPAGQRYTSGSSTVMFFVRETAQDDFGTSPYMFLGTAKHVSHEGERPIAITWKLDHPMPAHFYNAARVAAG